MNRDEQMLLGWVVVFILFALYFMVWPSVKRWILYGNGADVIFLAITASGLAYFFLG